MVELVLSCALEIVLLLIVIFVAIVYLQSKMESIWGEPLQNEDQLSTNSDLTLKDTKETLTDNSVNFLPNSEIDDNFKDTTSSSADEDFQLNINQKVISDIKSLSAADNLDIEDTSDEEYYLKASSSKISKKYFSSDSGTKLNENLLSIGHIPIENLIQSISPTNIVSQNISLDGEPNNKYIVQIPKHSTLLTGIVPNNDTSIRVNVLKSATMDRYYEVNGASFVEGEDKTKYDDDTVTEYELYKEIEDDDDWSPLEVFVQHLPQGVLVNSNVCLQLPHWHTLAPVDDHLVRCAVCQIYADQYGAEHHMETESHLRKLAAYKPLQKYDLSCVRKINSNLHCGVCNEIVDIMDYPNHENKKTHEDNLLKAINKVSDLMYDSNLHRHSYIDSVDGNITRNMSNNDRNSGMWSLNSRNVSESARNTPESDRNTPESARHTPERSRNNARNVGEYHFNAKALNNMCNDTVSVYEYSEEEEEYSSEEEEIVQDLKKRIYNVKEGFYPLLTEEEDIEEYTPPVPGFSYASMAKKPVIQLPKFLKIDVGTKIFRVRHDSWHMIIKVSSNQYYCMACNAREHVTKKPQHCTLSVHVERIADCKVLRAFEDHLVRQVNDMLVHCAHCNNLQYKDQIAEHIVTSHPHSLRNFVEQPTNQGRTNIQAKRAETDKSTMVKTEKVYQESDSKNPKKQVDTKHEPKIEFNIFGDIPLSPFGCVLRIPALNFNLIQKRGDEYYCAICDAICQDVLKHVEEIRHVELMTLAPFIKPFHNNLTRAVRGMLHCSLCNVLFPVSKVKEHNMDQPHTNALANALGMKRAQLPDHISRKVYKPTFLASNQGLVQPPAPALAGVGQGLPQPPVAISPIPGGDQCLTQPGSGSSNIPPLMSINLAQSVTSSAVNLENMKNIQVAPNVGHIPISGPNLDYQKNAQEFQNPLKAYNVNSTQKRVGETGPNIEQSIPKPVNTTIVGPNIPQSGQNIPLIRPNLTQPVQNLVHQNMPIIGQNIPVVGQHAPNIGQNIPHFGQTLPNPVQPIPYPVPNVNTETIKSIPPIFNPMFPQLPVNNQILNQQFVRPPYFNGPPLRGPPFPYYSPAHSPNLLSPSDSIRNLNYNPNVEMERKTLIITDKNGKNGTKSGNDDVKSGTDSPKPNEEAKKEADHSKSATNKTRHTSENSKSGTDNSRRSSEDSKCGTDNSGGIEDSDDEKDFDEEQMVIVKFKNYYFKITNGSYHSLVFLDKGLRYCFVCGCCVLSKQARAHTESRKHCAALADNKYLDKYGAQLYRQMYLVYHCAICNVVLARDEVRVHTGWAQEWHAAARLQHTTARRRRELTQGLPEHAVAAGREAVYRGAREAVPATCYKYTVVK